MNTLTRAITSIILAAGMLLGATSAATAQTNGWQLPWDDYGNKGSLTVPKCYTYCGVTQSYW